MKSEIKFYITESLFKLLENKNLEDIKITEIVKLSNISRTTFYNSFKNINDVLEYKYKLIINDLYDIYKLNIFRKKDNKTLLRNILKYINNNRNIFFIIKNKLYFDFKNNLDNYFISKINNKYNYYIISGIFVNLSLYFLDNNINIDKFLDKIKID